MEHIYPAFERGRIMKKELLWALRDYSYSALQLQYQNYPDGIISGCRIHIEDDFLCIAPGIIKCQDFIFLFQEEEKIKYAPTEEYIGLKFRMTGKEVLADYVSYKTEFVLDEHLDCRTNEIELCRFKLKEGARLRTDYKDFYDIQTEYDTVNLANATWSAVGGNTLMYLGFDSSVGISQVKVSTAKLLQENGYMDPVEKNIFLEIGLGINENDKIALTLENDRINIQYAAAYIKYQNSMWEKEYPQIWQDVAIQATIYNLGHQKLKEGWMDKMLGTLYAGFKEPREPHDNPEPNEFGMFVEESYDLMKELLEEAIGENITCAN